MSRVLSVRSLVLSVAVLTVASAIAHAQMGKLKPEEAKILRANVSKASNVTFWVVTQEFTGSFESVRENSERVKAEFSNQKSIAEAIGSFQPQGIVVLHEDPTGKGQFRMSVGFTVPSRVEAKPPLKVEQIKYEKAVRHTHVGRYQDLEAVYHGIGEVAKPDWPVVLRLIDDPERVPEEWRRTELIAPMK